MKNNFFPSTVAQSFLFIILGFLISIPIALPFVIFEKQINEVVSPDFSLIMTYIIVLIMIILLAYFVNAKRQLSLEFNFKLTNLHLLPLIFLLLLTFQIGLNFPLQRIIGSLISSEINTSKSIFSAAYIAGAVFLAPLLEEIIFRGIILKGLLTLNSPKKAIIISSIIFGLIHGQPGMIIGAIFFGFFFGYIYYKTNSLGLTMLLHFTSNLFGLIAYFLNLNFGSPNFKTITDLYGSLSWLLLLILIITFTASSYYLVKKINGTRF